MDGLYEFNIKSPMGNIKALVKLIPNGNILSGVYDLGANFYYNGIGTTKDLKKSKLYLEIASNFGLPRAIKKLQEYQPVYDSETNANQKVKQ